MTTVAFAEGFAVSPLGPLEKMRPDKPRATDSLPPHSIPILIAKSTPGLRNGRVQAIPTCLHRNTTYPFRELRVHLKLVSLGFLSFPPPLPLLPTKPQWDRDHPEVTVGAWASAQRDLGHPWVPYPAGKCPQGPVLPTTFSTVDQQVNPAIQLSTICPRCS